MYIVLVWLLYSCAAVAGAVCVCGRLRMWLCVHANGFGRVFVYVSNSAFVRVAVTVYVWVPAGCMGQYYVHGYVCEAAGW